MYERTVARLLVKSFYQTKETAEPKPWYNCAPRDGTSTTLNFAQRKKSKSLIRIWGSAKRLNDLNRKPKVYWCLGNQIWLLKFWSKWKYTARLRVDYFLQNSEIYFVLEICYQHWLKKTKSAILTKKVVY